VRADPRAVHLDVPWIRLGECGEGSAVPDPGLTRYGMLWSVPPCRERIDTPARRSSLRTVVASTFKAMPTVASDSPAR
jgi:hypothetical protein